MKHTLYTYKAVVTSVYDGDTCTVDFDLGLNTWIRNEKIRLYGINAPELKGKDRTGGLLSRNFLREQILSKEIVIQTIKDKKGKYGRYLGIIQVIDEKGKEINVNDLLVKRGFAVYKEY
jgi:micrococcal nuclease